jgi:hypothetical protein
MNYPMSTRERRSVRLLVNILFKDLAWRRDFHLSRG